jgi:hypothetical protein
LSAEVVRKPLKLISEKVGRLWTEEWAKEGERSIGKGSCCTARLWGIAEEVGSREELFMIGTE